MSALSPASKRALSNLRAFVPPKTNYYQCPLKRRAAVLILLFADRVGDLRVILTIRSAGLKNCEFFVSFLEMLFAMLARGLPFSCACPNCQMCCVWLQCWTSGLDESTKMHGTDRSLHRCRPSSPTWWKGRYTPGA